MAGAALFLLSSGSFAWHLAGFLENRRYASNAARVVANYEAVRAAEDLSLYLAGVEEAVNELALDLARHHPDQDQLEGHLKNLWMRYDFLDGAGAVVIADPGTAANKRLRGLYVVQPLDEWRTEKLGAETERGSVPFPWQNYLVPESAAWIEPHQDPVLGEPVAAFVLPFKVPSVRGEGDLEARLFATITVSAFRKLLGKLALGNTGYAFLLSRERQFLAHPLPQVRRAVEWRRLPAESQPIPNLSLLLGRLRAGVDAFQEYTNEITATKSLVFLKAIPANEWVLGVVFFKTEMMHFSLHKVAFELILQGTFSLMGLVLWWHCRNRREPGLWVLALHLSSVFIMAITLLLCVVNLPRPLDTQARELLLSKAAISRAMANENLQEPRVPIGLYVSSLSFLGTNDVALTGHAWMEGNREEEGFPLIFPDAVTLDAMPAYDGKAGHGAVWFFEAVIRQPMNYKFYPFDDKDIQLRIRPRHQGSPLHLIPDLDAYPLTNLSSLPGLSPHLIVPGWKPTASYFALQARSPEPHHKPGGVAVSKRDLVYCLRLQHHFQNILITHFTPLVVVAMMLFGLMATITTSDGSKQLINFNFSGFLGGSSALFFVVMLAHIQLRQELLVDTLIYMEVFYFTLYLMLLFAVVIAFLFARQTPWLFICFREALIPKALFWPLLLALNLGATFWIFYTG